MNRTQDIWRLNCSPEFRRFEETNTVDRGRFPNFTNDLRQAMVEEPVRFFVHVASRDRSS